MRIAIIDLGTNSVRFDIHHLGPKSQLRRLHREKIMVRLGTGIFLNGKLDSNAIRRTLQALGRFKRIADQYRVKKIIAFGTSALREAADRDRFLSEIHARTGIHIRVISGAEEAHLIARGILAGERKKRRFNRLKDPFALVDIGGGSTEISICHGNSVIHSQSFPVGTARIQQLFLRRSPPPAIEVAKARQYIRNIIFETVLPERWPAVKQVFGSSGTIRAVERILRKSSKAGKIKRTQIASLVRDMAAMSTSELLEIAQMEAKRVDMILSGTLIFDECMDILGAEIAETTEFSLRDGILEEELELHQQGKSDSHLALHLSDLHEKAKLLGADEDHLKRTSQLASDLFQKLRPLHKLKPGWEVYLVAAMILRDTGEAINVHEHPLHSAYIVRNSDLPAMDGWEIDFIANLCLHHENTKTGNGDLNFTKNKTKRETFLKLLALLKVADALDSGPEFVLKLKSIRIRKKEIEITYTGKDLTGLETLNIEKRSDFFEKVFNRKIKANWA
jgi:exopolyphosphatase/guanosine-5'-triphosphate,3'-diphosphate pyrophosphatase